MKKSAVLIIAAVSLLSCTKTEIAPVEPGLKGEDNVKAALLHTGWVLKHTALIYSPDLVDNSEPQDCKLDDVYSFKISGSADIEFGGL
ncbi:MAG: hypothetical protein U0V75_14500 [Ferruginibacter sp.]